eukprot:10611368-Karenia_brevis.AAC.1
MGVCIGQAFRSTNGVLQGCPLSVILLNAMVSVWANAVQHRVPGSQAEVFADNTQALTPSRRSVSLVAGVTDAFAISTGQSLSI